MWFSKKDVFSINLFEDLTDFHSHILCGVDDGISTLERSFKALDAYEKLGYKKVIFTPHIMEDIPQNNASYLRQRFEEFKSEYKGGLELSLGAEYMLDSKFEEHLDSGDLLTLRDNYLLVETSYSFPPQNLSGLINRVLSKGYFVVLAHPERYMYMTKEDYADYKNRGVLFQLNLMSLSGLYGKGASENALKLLEQGRYDLIGSDLHRLGVFLNQMETLKLSSKHLKCLSELKARCLSWK